jgi:hypothetical protein
LNPAQAIEQLARIRQVHLVGLLDRNVPAEQTKQALEPLANAIVLEFASIDHN